MWLYVILKMTWLKKKKSRKEVCYSLGVFLLTLQGLLGNAIGLIYRACFWDTGCSITCTLGKKKKEVKIESRDAMHASWNISFNQEPIYKISSSIFYCGTAELYLNWLLIALRTSKHNSSALLISGLKWQPLDETLQCYFVFSVFDAPPIAVKYKPPHWETLFIINSEIWSWKERSKD